jgi:hypothetical protein
MKQIIRPFMPPRPAGAPAEPDYSAPGVLEDIATRAGLTPEQAFDTAWPVRYRDEDTLRRALVAPAGIAVLVGPDQEEQVKDEIATGLEHYRTEDGGYELQNEYHILIARA